jgi:general nucleoside transport system permease protein
MLDVITNFLATDIRTAIPILIAALGFIYSERAGIVNIGAEGIMLIGALAGVAGSFYTGSAWYGVILAMIVCAAVALLFAFLTVTVRADQVVVGAALNILGLGLTTTLARVIFGVNTAPPKIDAFTNIPIPLLSDIPVIGPVLFNQNAIAYLTYILIPVLHFILFKTDIGLKIRAVGEHPKACDTVGINVYKVRYATIIFSGAMAGLAGSYVSLCLLSFFTENMIAGRGFIALAAVIFGKYRPLGALVAALVFGAGDALQFRLQAVGTQIPFQFLLMVPYVLTILALAGFVGRNKGPAASGVPYVKE